MTSATAISADHHQVLDAFRSTKVLMVVANPSVNPKLGWPLGFWAAELMHPYFEFTEAGFEVTVASPDGGKVEPDALSDPRDPSRWSAGDLVSMGFLNTPQCVALLVKTPKLADLELVRLRRARGLRGAVANVYISGKRGSQARNPYILRVE